MTTLYCSTDPIIKQLVKIAFPEYTGRNISVESTEEVSLQGTYWSGGYKSDYRAITLCDTPEVIDLPDFNPPLFGGPRYHEVPTVKLTKLPPDSTPFAVVKLQYAGVRKYVVVYVPPHMMAPSLEEDKLTKEERIVLFYTRSLKNSYGGETNIRAKTAKADAGMSQETWELTQKSLIEQKLLNKRGAITDKGRNAINKMAAGGFVDWTKYK